MKKIVFLVAFFSLMVSALQGQTSSMAQIPMPFQINKTIVREYSYPATISYVETNEMHSFVYDDAMGTTPTVSIDKDYSVNDFVIEGDWLYFCGCYQGTSGFMGRFNIGDFFFNNQTYEIFPDSYISPTEDVVTLTKLVNYTDGTYLHLLAIGETSLGASCVEDLYYIISTSSWQYQVGVLPLALGEKLLGVAVGEDYVVTAGLFRTTDRQLYVRVAQKNAPFFTSTLDQYEFFDNGGPLYLHVRDELAIASIGKIGTNDAFAVATIWDYHDLNNPGAQVALSGKGIFVTPFSVNILLQANPYNSSVTYQPYDTLGWSLQGMTRTSNYLNDFVVLHRSQPFSGSPVQSIVSKYSWNTIVNASSIPFWTTPDVSFHSIDWYNGGTQYVMNGILGSDPAHMGVGIGATLSNDCMVQGHFQSEPVNMTNIVNDNVPFTVYSPVATSETTLTGIDEGEMPKSVDCKY